MTIFGDNSSDMTPKPYNYWGMSGFFSVPLGWKVRSNADGSLTASPNPDFTNPTYDVAINSDGTYVFQDMLLSRQLGIG